MENLSLRYGSGHLHRGSVVPSYTDIRIDSHSRHRPPNPSRCLIGQDATRMAPNDADQFLATQIRLLQSDSVLRPVVERYKLPVDDTDLPSHGKELPTARAQEAPVKLKHFKVSRPPNTYLLLLAYRSPDPNLASDIANAIAHSYILHTYDIRFQAAAELSTFMEKQLEALKAKMGEVVRRIGRVREGLERH